jgi:hypothetical protein
MIRRLLLPFALAASAALSAGNPFLGKWDITAKGPDGPWIYWLEVGESGGKLTGMFLARSGSVFPLSEVKMEGDELVFWTQRREDPKVYYRARAKGGKLIGVREEKGEKVTFTGVRPPAWGTHDANAKHNFGTPVELFDGASLDAWGVQNPQKPMGWKVENGVMTNDPHANNLLSRQKFQDFKIRCEYKLEKGSNSGIYLRGRYELQVLEDFGKPAGVHGHMAIYSRVAPLVNASRPAGEWQEMEATIVGNRVTVFLNGQKVHDNQVLDGLTGGALDADEGNPGPVMIQGDHERVHFRRVTVWPIRR